MSKKELFIARVRDIASDGAAIVEHPSGQIFFVPGAWLGELVEVRVTGYRKRFGFGAVAKLIEPSPSRVAPSCRRQGFDDDHCGGCPWQFVDYRAQLDAKENRVRRALARFDANGQIAPIWSAEASYGYRNRAAFKSDGRVLGYMARTSNRLIPIEDCPILSDKNRHTLAELVRGLPNKDFRPKRKERWVTIEIDEDMRAEDVVANRRRPFRQANSAQNERMRQWLAQGLKRLHKDKPILELFAGSGNFTQMMSSLGDRQIVAVEGVAQSVKTLQGMMLPGVLARETNLFDAGAVAQLYDSMPAAEILVLNPPREGFRCTGTLLEKFEKLEDIFYISCDLATLARDLEVMVARGFKLDEVQPVDQFPHTPHVEVLVKLHRR